MAYYREQAEALGEPPSLEDHWPGAYSVGIGFGEPSGHLAVIVEGHKLLDLTPDQASRPHQGIHLPPLLIWEVNRRFLRGDVIIGLTIEATDPAHLSMAG